MNNPDGRAFALCQQQVILLVLLVVALLEPLSCVTHCSAAGSFWTGTVSSADSGATETAVQRASLHAHMASATQLFLCDLSHDASDSSGTSGLPMMSLHQHLALASLLVLLLFVAVCGRRSLERHPAPRPIAFRPLLPPPILRHA